MAHDVFISYSAKDKRAAEAACAFLEEEGIRCWIARRDVSAGTPWAAALVEAIQTSRAMLLVFSSRSNESEHVLREVSAAASAGIPILPFRVEHAPPSKELGYYIRRAHWLDAFKPPLKAHLPSLGDAMHRLLQGPAATDAGDAPRAPLREPRLGTVSRLFGSHRGRVAVLGALLAVGVVVALLAWLRRPGTLAIESEPAGATAAVDGVHAGSTPLALPVASGSHTVLLRRPGFKDWSRVIDLDPGEKASFSLQLVVADPRDADAVNLIASSLGVALQHYRLPEAMREFPQGEPLELIVPRGAVRPCDVTTLVMDADPERVDPSGVVALRRGETTLWDTPFDPETAHYEVSVPQAVGESVRPGETLVWGWWPETGPPVTTELHVVGDDMVPLFAEIDRRLEGQPAGIREHLRAQALLDHRFLTGAFLEARFLKQADPADLRAGALMEQALTTAGGGDLRFVARLRNALRDAPAADRARVFGSSSASPDR